MTHDRARELLVKYPGDDEAYLELCRYVEQQRQLRETVERLANFGSVDDYTVAGIRAELRDALVAA